MTDAQKKLAAKQFVKDWTGHGDEKQETQRFWMALLQKVFGVEEPEKAMRPCLIASAISQLSLPFSISYT